VKKRAQMDKKNMKERLKRARDAAEKAAAPVLPAQAPVPSAGEGVDAAVKAAAPVLPAQAPVLKVGPSPSKKQKAAVTAAKKLEDCIAAYGADRGRGGAKPAAPPPHAHVHALSWGRARAQEDRDERGCRK
jgi:hypothetical protein